MTQMPRKSIMSSNHLRRLLKVGGLTTSRRQVFCSMHATWQWSQLSQVSHGGSRATSSLSQRTQMSTTQPAAVSATQRTPTAASTQWTTARHQWSYFQPHSSHLLLTLSRVRSGWPGVRNSANCSSAISDSWMCDTCLRRSPSATSASCTNNSCMTLHTRRHRLNCKKCSPQATRRSYTTKLAA